MAIWQNDQNDQPGLLTCTCIGNRGRLPVTLYNKAYTAQVDFHDFAMAKPPGRTYKYYTGTPLFGFGHVRLVIVEEHSFSKQALAGWHPPRLCGHSLLVDTHFFRCGVVAVAWLV